MEADLVEQKGKMRDINLIPNIMVDSPSPEMPELRPTAVAEQSSFAFPPPPNPVEQAKMGLKPVPVAPVIEVEDVPTRTPSRLTFNEKVNKFKAISMENINQILKPPKAPQLNNQGAGVAGKHCTLYNLPDGDEQNKVGLMTSTPALQRGYIRSRENVLENKTVISYY